MKVGGISKIKWELVSHEETEFGEIKTHCAEIQGGRLYRVITTTTNEELSTPTCALVFVR